MHESSSFLIMYSSKHMFELHKKIKIMPLATGPGPVAKGDKKAWSGHILSKIKVLWVVPILCDKYNAYPQPKAKIMKFSWPDPDFRAFFVKK